MCKIAQMFSVSAVAVLKKWVRKEAESLKDPAPHADSDIVMILTKCGISWTKKKKIWVWRAIDGASRRPLGWELGTRGDSTAKRLIERADNCRCLFITDDCPGFHRLIDENRLFTGKDLTFSIEASNNDIRHRFARFIRKTNGLFKVKK